MATLSLISSANGESATTQTEQTCPSCGQHAELIPLGARIDRPHRWRPWVVEVTHLALCAQCGALAATQVSRRLHGSSWQPATPAA